MRSGKLLHRINFFKKTATRDDYGAAAITYPTTPTISTRGGLTYRGGSKMLSNDERFYSKHIELVVRYRDSIEETMRVQIDGTDDRYQIDSIEPVGRKQWLRIDLEKINL